MQILPNVFDNRLQIHFAFDLGVNDYTSVVGYQIRPDGNLNVCWCYQNNNQPYEHFINKINMEFGTRKNRSICITS